MENEIKRSNQAKADKTNELNKGRQGIDKAPGEERGKGDKVTNKDLKGKQVDEDPSTEEGKPLDTLKK